MKLDRVSEYRIYINSGSYIYEIDVSKNELYKLVKENNFSSVEIELLIKEYNKGIEKLLGEKIKPEYSKVHIDDIKRANEEFEKQFPWLKKRVT